jgi:antitoxin (DNA-binding transcriptional repressor) of toxin-antitoxin stability system
MDTVSVQDLQRDPLALLHRVEAGERIVVTRDDRAVAEIGPVMAARPGKRPVGLATGAFAVPDDFDAPLPESVLQAFEG